MTWLVRATVTKPLPSVCRRIDLLSLVLELAGVCRSDRTEIFNGDIRYTWIDVPVSAYVDLSCILALLIAKPRMLKFNLL